MITLFTGVPGTGKTAFVVSMLLEEAKRGRKIFVDGIPDLQIPHELCGDVKTWQEGSWLKINHYDPTLSDGWRAREDEASDLGALIVIDEAQRYFRPRSAGSAVPACVAAFETHRKQGLDFWIITQRPALIDANLRGLISKHYAIWHHWLGRYLFEWPNVGDVENKTSRDTAAKKRYKLPKHVFDLYKSAEVHTQQKHSLPFVAKAMFLIIPLLAFTMFKSWDTVKGKFNPETAQEAPQVAQSSTATPTHTPAAANALPPQFIELTPVVPNRPETAPAYDSLRTVKAMPWPNACIQSADRCQCYTAQGTRLNDITPDRCRMIIKEGGIFDPYRQPDEGQRAQPATFSGAPVFKAAS